MKYEVNFSCGHTATLDLVGPYKDRYKKIAWLEEEGKCPECYGKIKRAEREEAQKKEEQEIEKMEKELNFAHLVGSEKQVAWARSLRVKMLKAWDNEIFFKIHYKRNRRLLNALARHETSAVFWINSQNKEFAEVMNPYLEAHPEVVKEVKAEIHAANEARRAARAAKEAEQEKAPE